MPHARWEALTIPVGSTFVINQVANDGAGKCRFRTTAAHGLTAGDVVLITGCADATYNGEQAVTNVSDGTHFDVGAVAFGANDAGTVTAGTAKTVAVSVGFGERIVALALPAVWAASADVCFQVSRDGTNFLDLMDKTGAIIRVTSVAVNELRALANDTTAMDFPLGSHKVRLRSVNTGSAADVNQVETPTFHVFLSRG